MKVEKKFVCYYHTAMSSSTSQENMFLGIAIFATFLFWFWTNQSKCNAVPSTQQSARPTRGGGGKASSQKPKRKRVKSAANNRAHKDPWKDALPAEALLPNHDHAELWEEEGTQVLLPANDDLLGSVMKRQYMVSDSIPKSRNTQDLRGTIDVPTDDTILQGSQLGVARPDGYGEDVMQSRNRQINIM